MTNEKPRKLRPTELDDWFDNEVTRQYFSHIRTDLERELTSRMKGGCYKIGDPFRTLELMAGSAGREGVYQQYLDLEQVKAALLEGFEEEENEE